MQNFQFVERVYPILDSSGKVEVIFFGTSGEAKGYAEMLEELSNRNAVISETYTVGKSLPMYRETYNNINGDE